MRPRHLAPLAALLAVGALAAGCASGSAGTPPAAATPTAAPSMSPTPSHKPGMNIRGGVAIGPGATLKIPSDDGSECRGHSEYSDIKSGQQVEIRDAAGKVVSVATLEPSVALDDDAGCLWQFTVYTPGGGDFYQAVYEGWTSKLVAEAEVSQAMLLMGPGL